MSSSPAATHLRAQPWSRQKRLFAGLVILGGLALAASLLWYGLSASSSSEADRAGQAGLAYARQHLVWNSGPSIKSVHLTALRDLPPLLQTSVSPTVRPDVNVPDLMQRYGPDRRVALVVLTGVYNTLAPDEGVNVRGDMVVITDARTNRVLVMTD